MDDWFEWNGVRSSEYGFHVLNLPKFLKPKERLETISIPGRPGKLTILEGSDIYDPIDLSCTCVVDDPFAVENGTDRMSKIAGWLRGNGTIKFANRDIGYYNGRVTSQITFEKIVRGNPHRMFEVRFTCSPFFMLDSGSAVTTITQTTTITNPGNARSAPFLRIYFPDYDPSLGLSAEIRIADQELLIENIYTTGESGGQVTVTKLYDYIDIDFDAKYAYYGSTPCTTMLTGDWISFPAGEFTLTVSGAIASIQITPRWRCVG